MNFRIPSMMIMASFLLVGCWPFSSREFILKYPSYVKPDNPLNIKIDSYSINHEKFLPDNQKLNVELFAPKENLAGAGGIRISHIENETVTKHQWAFFDVFLPNSGSGFSVGTFAIGINNLVMKTDQLYRSDFQKECPTGNREPLLDGVRIFLVPRGTIVYEQHKKHLTLKGTFDIPPTKIPRDPYMICNGRSYDGKLFKNPAPPALIEIRGIHIDIDTDLTFGWCGKGGDCYEL